MREHKLTVREIPVPKQLAETGKYTRMLAEDASRHIFERIRKRTEHTLQGVDVRVQKGVGHILEVASEYFAMPIGIEDTFENHYERRDFRTHLPPAVLAVTERQRIRASSPFHTFAYIESLPLFVGPYAPVFEQLVNEAQRFQDNQRARYAAEHYDPLTFDEKALLAQETTKEILAILRKLQVLIRTHKHELTGKA
jgi:hypothetical protein